MKTLNRTFAITVACLLACCFLGLFLTGRFSHLSSRHYFDIGQDSLINYTEVFTILFIAGAFAWVIKAGIDKISNTHKQYYDLFESNPMPMVIVDVETERFIAVNKASVRFYGYSACEFCKMKTTDLWISTAPCTQGSPNQGEVYSHKKGGIRKHVKKNGQVIFTELSCTEVVFKNKNCKLFLARDITEIMKAKEEKRIAELENLHQKKFTSYVLENFPVDVAIFDKDHRYLLTNKRAVKNDEMRKWLVGKNDFEYFEKKGLDDSIAKLRRERFKKAVAGECTEWIDESCINGEKSYILRKFYPYREDGELQYVYGYGMDITEVRTAQLQREKYLDQLEKIAFTTSHKIRQPICNIQGLISLLEDGQADSLGIKKIIDCLGTSSKELDDLTRDLAIKLHEYKQQLSSPGE